MPAEATRPLLLFDEPVFVDVPGTPAEATLPTTPALEPILEPLPKPADPTFPWGAMAGPCMPP
jgi:hypothetical protein